MKYCLLLLFIVLPFTLWSQEEISGKVVSEKGNPVVNASVYIPNTSIGTFTNASGEFVLGRLPRGNFKLAVSAINYETAIRNIPRGLRQVKQIIRLKSKVDELQEVVIRQYDKEGWKKWGDLFINAFIGESSYAQDCQIMNKDAVRFIKVSGTDVIRAYAAEPLIIENKSLGYQLKTELADFEYNLKSNEVDYQIYTFFTPMEGAEADKKKWKQNREKVYNYSLMRFMRSLYDSTSREEGYEIHIIEHKANAEKERVQELYKTAMAEQQAGGDKSAAQGKNAAKMIEKNWRKDSVRYYRKILQQEDRAKKVHPEVLEATRIVQKTDSGTVILSFDQTLQVTNRKLKEPVEYINYRTGVKSNTRLDDAMQQQVTSDAPYTELSLTQQIPVEINGNGYFNNIDLFINGFWGWWEKMAVKLPYEYSPDE